MYGYNEYHRGSTSDELYSFSWQTLTSTVFSIFIRFIAQHRLHPMNMYRDEHFLRATAWYRNENITSLPGACHRWPDL